MVDIPAHRDRRLPLRFPTQGAPEALMVLALPLVQLRLSLLLRPECLPLDCRVGCPLLVSAELQALIQRASRLKQPSLVKTPLSGPKIHQMGAKRNIGRLTASTAGISMSSALLSATFSTVLSTDISSAVASSSSSAGCSS